MLRHLGLRLTHGVCLISHANLSATEQQQRLCEVLQQHDEAATHNRNTRNTTRGTYAEDACTLFAQYRLAVLPPTNGVHRAAIRASLCSTACDVLPQLRTALLQPWHAAAERTAVILGCSSIPYLRRQLQRDATHALLVVDRSLAALAEAAEALVPVYGARVCFVRCEAMFALLALLQPAATDVVVVPMPMPVWSARSSHRRLVTSEMLCAVHRVLRVRTHADDARGVVVFTDCEPYAAFMLDQLEQSKLIVPWRRKHAAQVYARWLPQSLTSAKTTTTTAAATTTMTTAAHEEQQVACEFAKQRTRHIVAFAASKCDVASPQALQLIESYDYKRRYWPALAHPPT